MPSWCWLVLLARPSIMAAKLDENLDSSPSNFPPSLFGSSLPSDEPRASSSDWTSTIMFPILIFSSGRHSRMWWMSIPFRFLAKFVVPHFPRIDRFWLYTGCVRKNRSSFRRPTRIERSASMSRCPRLTTAMYPRLRGMTRLCSMSLASVPGSIRSSLVSTPMVLSPLGSSSLASLRASLLARSVFAPVTASSIALGFDPYCALIWYICSSMSAGWSCTATFVSPGRSTMVRLRTCGE
mmetsp:Transcript_29032/g.65555  ORF Transcript_29032/g.65555 Transcript_29032/m.65555 type:complete len:238 (+) Transcript_29032:156-869(+)